MRTKLTSATNQGSQAATDSANADGEAATSAPGRKDTVLGAVMVICVAVVAVLLLRRPSIVLRGARRARTA